MLLWPFAVFNKYFNSINQRLFEKLRVESAAVKLPSTDNLFRTKVGRLSPHKSDTKVLFKSNLNLFTSCGFGDAYRDVFFNVLLRSMYLYITNRMHIILCVSTIRLYPPGVLLLFCFTVEYNLLLYYTSGTQIGFFF